MLDGVKRWVGGAIKRVSSALLPPPPKHNWYELPSVSVPEMPETTVSKGPTRIPRLILEPIDLGPLDELLRRGDRPYCIREYRSKEIIHISDDGSITDDGFINRKMGAIFEAQVARLKQKDPTTFTDEEDAQVQRLIVLLKSGKSPQDDDSKNALGIIIDKLRLEKGPVDVEQDEPKTLREAVETYERKLIASQ